MSTTAGFLSFCKRKTASHSVPALHFLYPIIGWWWDTEAFYKKWLKKKKSKKTPIYWLSESLIVLFCWKCPWTFPFLSNLQPSLIWISRILQHQTQECWGYWHTLPHTGLLLIFFSVKKLQSCCRSFSNSVFTSLIQSLTRTG